MAQLKAGSTVGGLAIINASKNIDVAQITTTTPATPNKILANVGGSLDWVDVGVVSGATGVSRAVVYDANLSIAPTSATGSYRMFNMDVLGSDMTQIANVSNTTRKGVHRASTNRATGRAFITGGGNEPTTPGGTWIPYSFKVNLDGTEQVMSGSNFGRRNRHTAHSSQALSRGYIYGGTDDTDTANNTANYISTVEEFQTDVYTSINALHITAPIAKAEAIGWDSEATGKSYIHGGANGTPALPNSDISALYRFDHAISGTTDAIEANDLDDAPSRNGTGSVSMMDEPNNKGYFLHTPPATPTANTVGYIKYWDFASITSVTTLIEIPEFFGQSGHQNDDYGVMVGFSTDVYGQSRLRFPYAIGNDVVELYSGTTNSWDGGASFGFSFP